MRKMAGVILILMPLIGWLAVQRWAVAAGKPKAAKAVIVSQVVQREVLTRQNFVGTVEPLRTSVVGSAVDGRVIEFLVNEGDAVEANQPLAKLRTETLEILLAAARAEFALRQSELTELKNGSRPEEILQTQAKLAATAASMKYQKSKHERIKSLFNKNRTVTDDQLLEAESATERAIQLHTEAKAVHTLAVAGPRREQIAQAVARVLMQSEQVNLIQSRIKKHTIRSPFAGYVTAEHTEIGEWVSESDPIAEIFELDTVHIRAYVLGKHTAHLSLGAKVPVTFPAVPGEVFSGTVAIVIPKADARSRSFPVKIRMKNKIGKAGPLLKPGMAASVQLPTGAAKQALLVPKDAVVLEDGERNVIFIVETKSPDSKQGIVKRIPVAIDLNASQGTLIPVTGAITKNQYVVIRGNERLRAGEEVKITKILKEAVDRSP